MYDPNNRQHVEDVARALARVDDFSGMSPSDAAAYLTEARDAMRFLRDTSAAVAS